MASGYDWGVLVAKRDHYADASTFVLSDDGWIVALNSLAIFQAALEADHNEDGATFMDGFAAGICRLVFRHYGWNRTLWLDEWNGRGIAIEALEPDWWDDWPPRDQDFVPSIKGGFTRDYRPWRVEL